MGALRCGSEACAKHWLVVRSEQLELWAWAQSPALPLTAWSFSVKEEMKQLKGLAQALAPRKQGVNVDYHYYCDPGCHVLESQHGPVSWGLLSSALQMKKLRLGRLTCCRPSQGVAEWGLDATPKQKFRGWFAGSGVCFPKLFYGLCFHQTDPFHLSC